jgi:hypothetical protein
MQKWLTLVMVTVVALGTGCTASNPIQRELGQASRLELTNKTANLLELDLVAGTTGSEIQKDEVIAHISLAPGQRTGVQTFPGRYTLFPQKGDQPFGNRSLAFSGVRLDAQDTQTITISERQMDTFTGKATRLVFQAS